MKCPVRQRTAGLKFDLTPLIDVVFLLIIFFLAASHLVRSESQLPVELPSATQGKEEINQTPRRLVITIPREGNPSVGGRTLTPVEVEQMLLVTAQGDDGPVGLEVRFRCDKAVPYERVEPLLLACARAGITHTGFNVETP